MHFLDVFAFKIMKYFLFIDDYLVLLFKLSYNKHGLSQQIVFKCRKIKCINYFSKQLKRQRRIRNRLNAQ